ncbi:MAG: hypothetical protein V8R39_02200 [Clostridia bacterium]
MGTVPFPKKNRPQSKIFFIKMETKAYNILMPNNRNEKVKYYQI